MADRRVIDMHAHILSEETIRLLQKESSQHAPKLRDIDADGATLEMGGATQRPFPRGAWDLDVRLKMLDDNGIDVQVLAVVPHTLVYDLDPSVATTFSTIQNEQIAAQVRAMPDRFEGLATLPMQAPEAAAAELRRAVTSLGLRGAMLGSHVAGRNLDDPALEPVWAAADELSAFIYIHPQKTMGGDRLGAYYLKNLIGNPLDTTVAAASLVFGGVMDRYRNLNICLVHGGGFTPYQGGRWVHGWDVRPEPRKHLSVSPQASLDRFYYDTLTHSQPTLRSLIEWVGPSRVLLGTDYPFDMGEFDCAARVRALKLASADEAIILGGQTDALLGRVRAGRGA